MAKLLLTFAAALAMALMTEAVAQNAPSSAAVLDSMRKVADWQLAQPLKKRDRVDNWVMAVFYMGVMALGEGSGDEKYYNAMEKLGVELRWRLGHRIYSADDHALGQTYAELFLLRKKKEMID